MSIAGEIAAATSADATAILALPVVFFTGLSIILAVRAGVFTRGRISGPNRLPGSGRLTGLSLVLLMGLSTWIFAQAIYANRIVGQWKAAGNTGTPDLEAIFTPMQFAVFSVMPALLAFACMLVADRMVSPELPRTLGVSPKFMGRGALIACLAILIVFPWILWTNYIAERLYQYFHFAHPMQHPLLKSLGESKERAPQLLILISAMIAAPLFEELLFRGHLQTLLRQGLAVLAHFVATARAAALAPSPGTPGEGGGEVSALQAPEANPLPPAPNPHPNPLPEYRAREQNVPLPGWCSWVAIVVTSLLFAAVHPSWSWPPIFVLSMGLGYVYERTGNLWASISLHLIFNGLQTLQFILLMRGG